MNPYITKILSANSHMFGISNTKTNIRNKQEMFETGACAQTTKLFIVFMMIASHLSKSS